MTITISVAQAGLTVGTLLKRQLGVSGTLLGRLKRQPGALLRNGAPVFTNAILAEGDILQVDLRDPPAKSSPIPPIPLPLDILYEDEDLLIVNKSAPLAVHPSSFAPNEPTLANGLAARWGGAFTFHPVNRLDRGTTGVMAVAKSQYIHNLLRQQLHSDRFYREYLGIAVGTVTPSAGQITLPIGRAEGSPIKRCVRADGAPAVSVYETLETAGGLTLLRLLPKTGRTHQLRLHMAAIGHPLAGDWLYGTEDRRLIARPALHAWGLTFRHPVTGKLLSFQAELPADLAQLLHR